MDDASASFAALCVLAILLGARHGFDADHLATIDGLTRRNARDHPRLARAAGALFSLGHGVVVIAIAWLAGTMSAHWKTPEWLAISGVALSVAVLFGLAAINARAVLVAQPNAMVALSGIRSRLFPRIIDVRSVWGVAAVGLLFAISFDTVSQAALFALVAARFGGAGFAIVLALLFVLGMFAVDAVNGAWISGLIRRADRRARVASRVMALAIAGMSFAIGVYALLKLVLPTVEAWARSNDWVAGAAVVVGALAAYAAAMIAARRAARA